MSNAMHLQRTCTPGAGKKNYRLSGLVQTTLYAGKSGLSSING